MKRVRNISMPIDDYILVFDDEKVVWPHSGRNGEVGSVVTHKTYDIHPLLLGVSSVNCTIYNICFYLNGVRVKFSEGEWMLFSHGRGVASFVRIK